MNVALAACSLLGLANAAVFLIDLRAQVQATIQDKAVPLLQEVMRKKGLQLDAAALTGSTALHLAALGGHPDVVCLLCQYGALPTTKNALGYCPVQLLAPCSATECVCVCNKLWSIGCRTERARKLLLQARRAQTRHQVLVRVWTVLTHILPKSLAV